MNPLVPRVSKVSEKFAQRIYQKLVADITQLYQNTREAVGKFYWSTGRWIVEAEQNGAVRARYGAKLLKDLSKDLSGRLGSGFSVQNLRKMRRIYLASRKRPTSVELTWSQQVELLPLGNVTKREKLIRKAIREGLTAREIRALVRSQSRLGRRKHKFVPGSVSLLVPKKGKIGVYRIIKVDQTLQWDKGFAAYRELSPDDVRTFKDGDFVRRTSTDALEKVPDGKPSDLYTYESDLIRAIDADTFWMRVWTARPDWRREKLRLRGIDAPELSTPEGRAAKRFVEALFKKAQAITVTTTKPDKYHRYLSDVFLLMPDGEEIFLNNRLLETGHAWRTDNIPLTEWEKE